MAGNKNKTKRFLLIVLVFLIFLLVSVFVAAAFLLYTNNTDEKVGVIPLMRKSVPELTNFAILGVVGDGTRTEMIVVGSFNSVSGAVNIISIPRDTYVQMPEERLDILRAEGGWAPDDGVMKINEVYGLAGKKNGIGVAVAQLEELLGIKIDYRAKVDLTAFRHIVDAIGGVEFNVPQRIYYNNPEQNLYIDLYPGIQILNGEQAECLVLYRISDKENAISSGYDEDDVQRVKMQQEFIREFISQAISNQSLWSTSGALVTTIFKYVETDFGIIDATKYVGSVKGFSSSNINFETLPSDVTDINGQSFVIKREPDASQMIENIFGQH